jgi:transposase
MVKFKKNTKNNVKFIDSDKLYDKFIDKNSLLVKIHDLVDFNYYLPILEPLYSDYGRSAHHTILMFKVCILQYVKNGLSDREVIAQAKTNLEYRYFLDLSIDDELPHFTKIGTFRTRLGKEKFAELFDSFVNNLKELGIITSKQVRFMDATHQLANATTISITTLVSQACENLVNQINKYEKYNLQDLNLSTKDFLLSEEKKKERFVLLIELSQKLQVKAQEILSVNEDIELKEAYNLLCRIVKERSTINDGEIQKKNSNDTGKIASVSDTDATWGSKSKDFQFLGYKHNVTAVENGFIEAISTHQGHKNDEEFFINDLEKIDGEKVVADGIYGSIDNRRYANMVGVQLVAPCRKNMKAHLHDELMDEAFIYNHSEQYKKEMKKRGSLIEGRFGIMKKVHHFARAKYRGIEKVSIQGLITAFVMNLKAVVKWYTA